MWWIVLSEEYVSGLSMIGIGGVGGRFGGSVMEEVRSVGGGFRWVVMKGDGGLPAVVVVVLSD